jgi:hypothetical protein
VDEMTSLSTHRAQHHPRRASRRLRPRARTREWTTGSPASVAAMQVAVEASTVVELALGEADQPGHLRDNAGESAALLMRSGGGSPPLNNANRSGSILFGRHPSRKLIASPTIRARSSSTTEMDAQIRRARPRERRYGLKDRFAQVSTLALSSRIAGAPNRRDVRQRFYRGSVMSVSLPH